VGFISTRSRYGLRFLIDLAEQGQAGPIDLASIAARQEISEQYLSKLTQPLKAAGLVRTERGAKGGYELAKAPHTIDLWTVVEALEGHSALLECSSHPESCPRSNSCRTLPVWTGLDRVVRDYLERISLADAARLAEPDYTI